MLKDISKPWKDGDLIHHNCGHQLSDFPQLRMEQPTGHYYLLDIGEGYHFSYGNQNLKRNHWVIDEKWDNWFQQRFITEHQLRLPCFLVIDTCRCKRRFWRTMTDKILKEEMPNVNIGYPHEKRLVFWCKAYSRKIVWGHCHEKEISKQAKEVDPKKISWQLCLCH